MKNPPGISLLDTIFIKLPNVGSSLKKQWRANWHETMSNLIYSEFGNVPARHSSMLYLGELQSLEINIAGKEQSFSLCLSLAHSTDRGDRSMPTQCPICCSFHFPRSPPLPQHKSRTEASGDQQYCQIRLYLIKLLKDLTKEIDYFWVYRDI